PPWSPLVPYTTLFRSVPLGCEPPTLDCSPRRDEGAGQWSGRADVQASGEADDFRRRTVDDASVVEHRTHKTAGPAAHGSARQVRSEEHTSELQSRFDL